MLYQTCLKLKQDEGSEEQLYTKEPDNEYQKMLRKHSLKLHNHKAMNHSKRLVERFSAMKWGDSTSDVPEHLKPLRRNTKEISNKVYDQNNRRMYPHRPCHTIPASILLRIGTLQLEKGLGFNHFLTHIYLKESRPLLAINYLGEKVGRGKYTFVNIIR